MMNQDTVLVIDAGNTVLKIAVFTNGNIVEIQRFESTDFIGIEHYSKKYSDAPSIMSSVVSFEETKRLENLFLNCYTVNNDSPLPIKLIYLTPKTLGIDRICNAVAIAQLCPNKNAVSIDLGTCLKFDFVNRENQYVGGSISPGIHLRYKSLNDYTSNLPLIRDTNAISLIGKSTVESIHSGVINGIQAEINHLIQRYSEEYSDLTFFMTGGDIHYFDFPVKSNIFVDEILTLKGLYQIYLFNAH
jgi:type III pantothenate kinase